jgi:hypothetical protein
MGIADQAKLRGLLLRAKSLASEYYELTKKPLGVTGEVAELEAAEKLGLVLADARTPFYDAFQESGATIKRFQIKGRAVALSSGQSAPCRPRAFAPIAGTFAAENASNDPKLFFGKRCKVRERVGRDVWKQDLMRSRRPCTEFPDS